jgi:hypothetical protein
VRYVLDRGTIGSIDITSSAHAPSDEQQRRLGERGNATRKCRESAGTFHDDDERTLLVLLLLRRKARRRSKRTQPAQKNTRSAERRQRRRRPKRTSAAVLCGGKGNTGQAARSDDEPIATQAHARSAKGRQAALLSNSGLAGRFFVSAGHLWLFSWQGRR